MSVTIRDVAREAGVSTSTVSRAFTRPDKVSDDTRARIIDVATQLGFSVSRSATALKTGKTSRIALLLHDRPSIWFNSHIYDGLHSVLYPEGYDIAVIPINKPAERQIFFESLPVRRNADAVIVPSFNIVASEIQQLETLDMPIVGINNASRDGLDAGVAINDENAMRLMVNHLISLGHRRIAYVGLDPRARLTFSVSNRLRGFREAIKQSPAPIEAIELVADENDTHADGPFTELLGLGRMPTAICCQQDNIAIPLMLKLQRYGYDIPRDISITGLDDSTYAEDIGLTTMHQDPVLMARIVARKVLALIDGENVPQPFEEYPVKMVLRSSTAPVQDM